ncbi:MAG: (Fe-S)-binding protein [Desulfatibacillaceae bacterium]
MRRLDAYKDMMARCSHCAFCQATCPVFSEDLLETHMPRARMDIIRGALLDRDIPVNNRVREVLSRCLLCGACTRTCPAGVAVDEITMAARGELGTGGMSDKLKRRVMPSILRSRGAGGFLGKLAPYAREKGWLSRSLPILSPDSFQAQQPPVEGELRARVAYFVGCATNSVFQDTGADTLAVLAKNGIQAIVPEGIVCCGVPAAAAGDMELAAEMARENIKALSERKFDAIVTDCTTCGLAMRQWWEKVLPEDDPLRAAAAELGGKTFEVCDYLNQVGLSAKPGNLAGRHTYHEPCHRDWSPTLADAARKLLAEVPGAELVEMEEPGSCCGAGGSFFLEHRDVSSALRKKKTARIEQTGVDTVVTPCPSCRGYIAAGVPGKRVCHPVSLLARAYGIGGGTPSKTGE